MLDRRTAEGLLERVPPQNGDAEQAALGAMLLEREAIVRAQEVLSPEDFYRDAHRWIYRGVLDLYRRNEPVDLITLGEWLRDHAAAGTPTAEDNLLAQIGGTLYLTTLMESAPTAAGIAHYAAIVREKAMQRRLIAVADEIMQEAYLGHKELNELLRDSEGKIFALSERVLTSGPTAMPEVYDIARDAILSRKEADAQGYDVGFKTDLKLLNRVLTPIKPGEMVVVAGRPGMGKSALAMQVAVAAAEQGQRGIFFSLEMDQDSLAMRLLIAHGCDSWKANSLLYRTSHPDEVYGSLEGALETLRGVPLRVVDTPALCANDIVHLGRRAKYDGGLDFIVVDYLQLMDANERHSELYERIRAVSRELKQAAKTLKVAVIAISQLSRQVENRTPPRPMMSDLRESGQLEQDADKILLLYRPGYYGKRALQAAELAETDTTTTEIILAKQRNGPTDAVWTRFDPKRTWFYDIEE
ncbi:MAG: replicative DNA helicase [Armatimonadota bacterium]